LGIWSQREREQQQQSRNLQSLTGSKSAKESCEAAKAREESNIAPGGGTSRCSCEQEVLDERYSEFLDLSKQPIIFKLECVDTRCSYCSPDGSTCDRFSYGALFEETQYRDGMAIVDGVVQVGYFETNQYIVGRPEAVVYTEYTDPSAPGDHSCSMEIDGLMCAECEYVECGGDQIEGIGGDEVYYGLKVVCSNIKIGDLEGGMVPANDFETCDQQQIESIGGTQGVFEMYDPDYGHCYTSVEGCDRDKIELEQNNYYQCTCADEDLFTDGKSPFLENVEMVCNKNTNIIEDGTIEEICKTTLMDRIARTYSSYTPETQSRSIEEADGTQITILEWDCKTTKGAADQCKECQVLVGMDTCQSCTMNTCSSSSSDSDDVVTAPTIDCSNLDAERFSASADLCRGESIAGTPFEPFGVCGFGTAKVPVVLPPPTETPTQSPASANNINDEEENLPLVAVSLTACREKRQKLLDRGSYIDNEVMICECLDIDDSVEGNSGTLLACTTNGGSCGTVNGGSVCNLAYGTDDTPVDNDGAVCFREELVQGFLPDGIITPLTRTTTYTHGIALGNSLIGRTMSLTEYNDSECDLAVEGVKCQSCQLQTCADSAIGFRPLADCSNVIEHPSFYLDSCEKFPSYGEGLLLRFAAGAAGTSNDKNTFNVCSKEVVVTQDNGSGDANNEGDSDGDNTDGDDSSGSATVQAVDPSLPTTCQKAQPIVLPDYEQGTAITRSIHNNLSIISFVSSTSGLAPPSAPIESCTETGDGSDSPDLWYSLVGTGKGIHISVCRAPTNFDARISVYTGSAESEPCGALSCVSGSSESLCDTHWVAEKGTAYYIRVHGSSSSETGSFNLFLETLTDDITDLCKSGDSDTEFDQACLACSKEKTAKINSKPNPDDMNCQCIRNEAAGGYHLTCVDVSCLKCNPLQDVCGFDTFELDIAGKGNASTLASYESFYFLTENSGEEERQQQLQASEIVSIKKTECLEINDPYNQCMMAREELMKADDSKVFCECRGTSADGSYMLVCTIYDEYEYCALDGSGGGSDEDICATVLFGQTISQYGTVTSDFRSYAFEMEDGSEQNLVVNRSDNQCSVTVNGEKCSKCSILQCDNNTDNYEEDMLSISSAVGIGTKTFTDLSVDCSNVLGGEELNATFECGKVGESDASSNNLLSILVGDASPSESANTSTSTNDEATPTDTTPQTIPPDAFPPTMPPVSKPTSSEPPVAATTPEPSASTDNTTVDDTVETTTIDIDTSTEVESNEISGASLGLWQPQSLRQRTAIWVAVGAVLAMAFEF